MYLKMNAVSLGSDFTFSVLLTPVNFNDYDASIDSMNAVVIKVPQPGGKWEADENEVRSNYCLPPKASQFAASLCGFQCVSPKLTAAL